MCMLAEIQQLGLAGVLVLLGFSGLFSWGFFPVLQNLAKFYDICVALSTG